MAHRALSVGTRASIYQLTYSSTNLLWVSTVLTRPALWAWSLLDITGGFWFLCGKVRSPSHQGPVAQKGKQASVVEILSPQPPRQGLLQGSGHRSASSAASGDDRGYRVLMTHWQQVTTPQNTQNKQKNLHSPQYLCDGRDWKVETLNNNKYQKKTRSNL